MRRSRPPRSTCTPCPTPTRKTSTPSPESPEQDRQDSEGPDRTRRRTRRSTRAVVALCDGPKGFDVRAQVGAPDQPGAIDLHRRQVARAHQLIDLRSTDVQEDSNFGHAIQEAILHVAPPMAHGLRLSPHILKALKGLLAVIGRLRILTPSSTGAGRCSRPDAGT